MKLTVLTQPTVNRCDQCGSTDKPTIAPRLPRYTDIQICQDCCEDNDYSPYEHQVREMLGDNT